VPAAEITPEGLIVRQWLRRQRILWADLERVEVRELRHTVRRHPRWEVVRRGGGYWFRGTSDPGEVWYGEVVGVLKSGREIKLRQSFSQFRGEDAALKDWAEAAQAKLAESS
jgi:hypothetical protein